ncbi:S-adenosyl-L-methionine-dependent methyltransferase [Tothia fuscella]|uniref:S-adenosyl-L-methionine-dependent methyltransferase n=1 Tax=Tothia fuscella TaxID=1048955 RepID=A0A9P4TZA0_9PEZI|nr:S-adenosyl-L-methionine-dependent methyltransferase [Tothia fuscella]
MHDSSEHKQERGEAYEEEHVHTVYEEIASHFSSTRYKPWPIVERFLKDRPNGSIGLDIGCGNGKYLTVNPNVYIIASDRSTNLVQIAAKHRPHSAVVADILDLPHGNHKFDFAISIAVIHHLSTSERRIQAISVILDTLRRPTSAGAQGSKALIYVWALEQKGSRRGWDEGDEQDVMVPWVLKGAKGSGDADKTFQRYYHLYKKGELEEDIQKAGGIVLESGYEKDNWWAIAGPRRIEAR